MRYGSKNINESPDEGMSDKDFKKGQRGNGMIVEYRKVKDVSIMLDVQNGLPD